MDSRLINYFGIDDFSEDFDFDHSVPYKLEGKLKYDFEIENLLSFSLSKECIDYKVIEIFDDCNNEGENFYGNLVIINNKFELNFEYSLLNSNLQLNMSSHNIHIGNKISIEDFDYSDLEITLLTKDLFCTLLNNNEIYYCADIMIGISSI